MRKALLIEVSHVFTSGGIKKRLRNFVVAEARSLAVMVSWLLPASGLAAVIATLPQLPSIPGSCAPSAQELQSAVVLAAEQETPPENASPRC